MSSSFFLAFFFFFFLLTTTYGSGSGSGGFYVDLIHRDSPRSPLYDPSLSPSERLIAAARRSKARASYFHRRLTTPAAAAADANSSSSFQSEIIPNTYEYLMVVKVGTPASTIHAIADTGSDLTWTQCEPCASCYEQRDPVFDPRASSTYDTVPCESDACSQLPVGGCGSRSLCQYHYSYGDQSYTKGLLSTDTFSFDSEGRGSVSVPGVLFGCSHESNGSFNAEGGGLVGLGGGQLSLVSQLGPSIDHKFSYCLVPYSNADNATSLLYFGDKHDFSNAKSTPIAAGGTDTFYYLSLDTIGIGNATVSVRKAVRSSSSSSSSSSSMAAAAAAAAAEEGNIIIDSGTTLTLLDADMLAPLVKKVSELVKLPTVEDADGLLDLCFDVSGESGFDLDQLPTLEFGFRGTGGVSLPPMNSFREIKEGVVCLMMASSSAFGGQSIFGNIAQQNFHIGYDLQEKLVYFEPKDCAHDF